MVDHILRITVSMARVMSFIFIRRYNTCALTLLSYDKNNLNAPGVLLKKPNKAGALGAAFGPACRASLRVVKELVVRFPTPIPRAVVRSLRQQSSSHSDGMVSPEHATSVVSSACPLELDSKQHASCTFRGVL